MPIITMLVRRRPSGELGHSPSESRASITWPTISAAVRLRTSFIVPVKQKRQLSVQPTWLETHSVPRSASGMNTISYSSPAERSSHLRVPSVETCASITSGRPTTNCASSPSRSGFDRSDICANSVTPRL